MDFLSRGRLPRTMAVCAAFLVVATLAFAYTRRKLETDRLTALYERGLRPIGDSVIMQVDYNDDGLTDLFILRRGGGGIYEKMPWTLLRNNGDGSFTDVTVESGLVSGHPAQTAVWADFNNDGWPDVFIGHGSASPGDDNPCECWINNQDGTFTELTKRAGCAGCTPAKKP
jgi:hypothetical protein